MMSSAQKNVKTKLNDVKLDRARESNLINY